MRAVSKKSVFTTATAPGKINLFFAVGDVQPSGYHPVASLYAATSLVEKVTVREADEPGISLSISLNPDSPLVELEATGEFDVATIPLDERNLAWKAAAAVLERLELSPNERGVAIHISKAVPVAGGMGGGSADAAAALKAVNEFVVTAGWSECKLEFSELVEIASHLGADVPFALHGGVAVGEGKGDMLTPLELPEGTAPLHVVMVLAPFGLSTPEVFAELDRGRATGKYESHEVLAVPPGLLVALQGELAEVNRAAEVAQWIANDLQDPACALAPELREWLRGSGLPGGTHPDGVLAGFVSGSGPTLGFLVDSVDTANQLVEAFAAARRRAVAVEVG